MLIEVCRAFHQSPDTVRGWQYEDYKQAINSICEIPWADKALYYGFFKPKEKSISLGTKDERDSFIDRLAGKGQTQ